MEENFPLLSTVCTCTAACERPWASADDTQILEVCRPSDTDELQHRVSDCLDAVSSLMAANQNLMNINLNLSNTADGYSAINTREANNGARLVLGPVFPQQINLPLI